MLSRRDLISSPANNAIADGDDLLMTPSFEAEEENSSVVANASCRTRSIAVATSNKTKTTPTKSIEDETEGGLQFSKQSLKVKKLLKRVRKLPRTIRQNSFLFRSSSNTVAEYEEMLEDRFLEEEENYEFDAETIASLRSSRNNVRTGMSMLVRQNALVMNRPSSALSNREILQSPSRDPKFFRAMLLRGKSLVLDDSSITSGMSDITEDASAVYTYPKIDHLSFRRTPMFINANTYRINEDEDESESDSDETDIPSPQQEAAIDRAYDFRELSPLNDGIQSVEEASHISDETETRSNAYDQMRRRIYSDSENVVSDAYASNLSSLTMSTSPKNFNALPIDHPKSSNNSNAQAKGVDRTTGATALRKVAQIATWPFPRTRTHSDSYVAEEKTKHNKLQKSPHLDIGLSKKRSMSQEQLILDTILTTRQYSRRQSLPNFQSNGKSPSKPDLRIRTYSDSIVNDKLVQEDISWDPRNISLLDTESIAKDDFHNSPTRPLLLGKELNALSPETPTTSVLATLSNTNTNTNNQTKTPETKKQQSQRPLIPSPSPRTLTAASKIAAALRPTPEKHVAAIPSPSARQSSSDQYYWGKEEGIDVTEDQHLELKNLCSWSSDSLDDIF